MKKFLASFLAALMIANPTFAGTSPIYINNSPLTIADIPPNIDATAFLNRSTFDVFSTLPFTGQNVLFWTNTGIMTGTPGYRFDYETDGTQKKKRGKKTIKTSKQLQGPSEIFYNDGDISVTASLAINANNIINPGRLDGSETAFISLLSSNGYADLSRGGIRIGPATGALTPCTFFTVSSNFTADTAISDVYWGGGRGDAVGTNGTALSLPTIASGFSSPNFSLPFPTSPLHEVISRSGSFLFTNTTSVGANGFGGLFGAGGCGSGYTAYVHTNINNATNTVINVVFLATNSLISPSNLNVDVRFTSAFGPAGSTFAPVVEFRNVDFDIVNQAFITNFFTLIDATASQTNVVLARPRVTTTGTRLPNTRRPSTFTWFRGRFCNFDSTPIVIGTNVFFTGAEPANSTFDPGVFYNALFVTNSALDIYAASSVNVGQTNSSTFGSPFIITGNRVTTLGVNPGLSDPTNFTGNVNIFAKELNLASTRIKAEDFIGIHTDNLVSNTLAQLDAPFIDFDVATTNSDLVLSNIAPAFVNRLFGTVSAWSGAWTVAITNAVTGAIESQRFNVLIVDNCLESEQTVTLNRFKVEAPNLVIQDNLFINNGAEIHAPGLTIYSNASINLPSGSSFAYTNVADLLNFTNYGSVNLSGAAYFGIFEAGHVPTNAPPKKKKKKKNQPPPPGPAPLENFVNYGSVAGSSVLIRSTNVIDEGRLFFPATISGNGGVVLINGQTMSISNAEVVAASDIEFHGDNLKFASTHFSAGTISNALGQYIRGALVIDATNQFGDFETMSTNDWFVTSGVRLPNRPTFTGDLLGTRIYSSAGPLVSSSIVWPGEDRGATVGGFSGNLALGRLVLDGRGGNLFRFRSAITNNALYVDYLELRNDATNFNFSVGVDSDFTIYFGDSNLGPERLNAISGGRLRWVSDYTGPQSSTNLLYPNGVTYTFNAGLVRSLDIDSDNDTVPNGLDCTPIAVPGFDTTGDQCTGGIIFPPAPPRAAAAAVAIGSSSDLGLTISLSRADGEVTLNWNAPAGAISRVEFADRVGATNWQTLTNLISRPENTRVTVKDAAGAPLRVYRVRVDAGNR